MKSQRLLCTSATGSYNSLHPNLVPVTVTRERLTDVFGAAVKSECQC